MIPSRRRFLLGAGSLLMAPAIVRVASLMPVSVVDAGEGLTLDKILRAKAALEANDVFVEQYRQEIIAAFERRVSLIRKIITTENELPRLSPWLVAEQSK